MIGEFMDEYDEKHGAAMGAFSGFVTGLTNDARYAGLTLALVLRGDKRHEHPADAHDEAAYTSGAFLAFFVLGVAVRRRLDTVDTRRD